MGDHENKTSNFVFDLLCRSILVLSGANIACYRIMTIVGRIICKEV